MSKGSGDDRFAYLNQLSTEDLETLIRADLERPEGGDERTMRILEVILKREGMTDEEHRADTQRARADFDTYYNVPEGEGRSLYGAPEPDAVQPEPEAAPPSAPVPRRKATMRRILIVAAVIVLLVAMTLVPVSGYRNLIQMALHFTAEQLHIQIDGLEPEKQSELPMVFLEWKDELAKQGVKQPVFPKRIPDGFELIEAKEKDYPDSEKIDFTAVYLRDEEHITMYFVYERYPDGRKLEWDDEDSAEPYPSGGITHQIFTNSGTNTAYWSYDTLVCHIDTSLSVSDLKDIVDSIYEE